MYKFRELIKVKGLLLFLVMGLLVINYHIPLQDGRLPFSSDKDENLAQKEGISLQDEEFHKDKGVRIREQWKRESNHDLTENIRKVASNEGNLNNRVRRLKSDEEVRNSKLQEIVNNTPMEEHSAETLLEKSEKHDLDIYLLLGLIRVESVFDPTNVSSAGALGLMQLMPSTARNMASERGVEYSEDRLFDPEYNIKLGTLYVNQLMETYDGDIHKALTAYNRGEGGLQSFINSRGTAESGFSRIVLEKKEKYEEKLDVSYTH